MCEALGRTGASAAVAPLARCLMLEESPGRALPAAEALCAIELDGEKAWSWGARGEVHMRRLELPLAVADFDKAIALSPTTAVDAWLHRGECRVQLGDEPGAIADLTRFLELAPPGHRARREATRQLEQLRR